MQSSSNIAFTKKRLSIGIDLLGGDTPPQSFCNALNELTKKLPHADFVLFLTEDLFSKFADHPSVTKIAVTDCIGMEEKPLHAIRTKKNSSLVQGMKYLSENRIDAFVSIGNTGALLGCAKMHLEMLHGVERPALLAELPTRKNPVAVLDVGGNLLCKIKHLLQFAKMGIAYQKSKGKARPTIGLLNIGSEAVKGPKELRELHQKLTELYSPASSEALFFGNVEGKTVFEGVVDVLITDGFSGNIFLKTAEGVSSFLLDSLPKEALKNCDLEKTLQNHRNHGGLLCGVEKIVIKCHGDASELTLQNAVVEAFDLLKNHFIEKLSSELCTKKQ